MYRLHIDVPCGTDQKEAIALAKDTLLQFKTCFENGPLQGIEVGVRLGCDEDRGTSNYLEFTSSGHCLNKKIKIKL